MRFFPVVPDPGIDDQRHIQFGGGFHALGDLLDQIVDLAFLHFEHQLIVHLHDHQGVQFAVFQPVVNLDHGVLDDVGGGALHGRVDGGALGGLAALATFFWQGVHHILIGYDHILFLLTLLFPAVLVWRQGAWQPKESMREALLTTLGIVTAFTVTHSLTLALASLGLVNLPSWLVESAIAITVGLGALSNLAPRYFPRRWVMALVFGLIHGLGFAAVLADLGLDGGSLVLTLLGFNLGVEAGQALIVLVFVPAAFLVRRTAAYRRWFVPIGSVAIIAIATVWAVDRLSGAL